MDIKRYGWVKDGEIPFVEADGLTFHGLPSNKYPEMFDTIIKSIDIRFYVNRPHVQHKHYNYKPDDTVVEVGAYLGYYAMNVAQKAGQVLAIEMIPSNYNIMKMNLEPYPNATTVMRGVTNKTGKGIACLGYNQMSSLRPDVTKFYSDKHVDIEVELDTLDNILDECKINEVDMMIIQVNGSELEVLEGLTLSRVKNIVIAVPYTEEGIVKNILTEHGFEVIVDNVMVYGQASGLPE